VCWLVGGLFGGLVHGSIDRPVGLWVGWLVVGWLAVVGLVVWLVGRVVDGLVGWVVAWMVG